MSATAASRVDFAAAAGAPALPSDDGRSLVTMQAESAVQASTARTAERHPTLQHAGEGMKRLVS
ncbi:MAG: hypothetical protein ABI910_04460 [Gemmatimonadota bacterium]